MKKIITLVLALFLTFALASCGFFQSAKSISFSNAPASSYTQGQKVEAKDFTIVVETESGSETFALTDGNLTVQGLDGSRIDTKTAGVHTIKVSYNGVTISFKYTVVGTSTAVDNWFLKEASTFKYFEQVSPVEGVYTITSGGQLAFLSTITMTKDTKVVLGADIDLSAHEWTPINFIGTFDGQGHKITGLKITQNSYAYTTGASVNPTSGLGLFNNASGTIKNLTLESPVLDMIKDGDGNLATAVTCEKFKNMGFVASISSGITIEQVDVYDGYINCVGRSGGLVGQFKSGTAVIRNCYVEAEINSYNPVSASEDDGEADKLGGIIGQCSNSGSVTLTMEGCQVKVVINGTRDIGGMIGYIGAGQFAISNCKVLDGSVISASVAGGMTVSKGARYVGGIIGTIAGCTVELSNNKVLSEVVILSNNLYDFSYAGKVIGGVRPESLKPTSGNLVTIGGVEYKIQREAISVSKVNQAEFLTWLKGALAEINK